MSIFNEEYCNYLTEHGGAHRRIVNNKSREINDNIRKSEQYYNIAKTTPSSKAKNIASDTSKKYYDKAMEIRNRMPYSKSISNIDAKEAFDKKTSNEHNNSSRPYSFDNQDLHKYKSKIAGAGKENMPKNREAGTYLKAQNKMRNVKEACEYILSILEESEYIDNEYDLYNDEY